MKFILSILLIFILNFSYSQITVKLEGEIYKEIIDNSPKKVNLKNDVLTGKYYLDKKGNKHPVYKTRNGKLFIVAISRNGNQYKKYLKTA